MKPYFSFVTAARNDDFGGNFLNRLQACVNSILIFSHKYNFNAELIIMEWNPPADKPRLKDAIKWPENIKPARVRIIEVPNEIHRQYRNSDKIPFFEFYAKNAGLRRAKGEYALVTNSDIVFSEEIIEYLAKNKLSQDVFCRVDRYDIKGTLPLDKPIEEQLKFCKEHVVYIQNMHGMLITSREEWFRINVLNKLKRLSLQKIKSKLIKKPEPEKIPAKPKTGIAKNNFQGLFIHVGGDFMLMSKKNWDKFKGYPEIGIDRGLDCYMTIMSHIAGLLQVILPFPIYHQEHDRTAQLLRPTAVLENMPAFEKMLDTNQPVVMNDDNWGLAKVKLKETVIE